MTDSENNKKDLTNLTDLSASMPEPGTSSETDAVNPFASQLPSDPTQPESISSEFSGLTTASNPSDISLAPSGISIAEETAPLTQTAQTIELPSVATTVTPPPIPPAETETASATVVLDHEPSISSPSNALTEVKEYSQQLPLNKSAPLQAAFPFSLLIIGNLSAQEREKLLDVLSRHNIGVREVDLEPQFESGKVLIPRISEYAAIMILQAMRSASVEMKLGPSDEIFATEDTRSEHTSFSVENKFHVDIGDPLQHPAENMPVTSDASLPELPRYAVIDTLTASASLTSKHLKPESSSEYQEILENLQRELKYKAYRRGAKGIIKFQVQLTQLSFSTSYKITVVGTAIRVADPDSGSKRFRRPESFEPTA